MKTALITGGTGGIGQGLVRAFCAAGWRVAFGWHQQAEAAQPLTEETGAIPLRADLRDEGQTLALFAAAMRQLSHLDALIVNAGLTWQGLLSDMPTHSWDDLMAVNLRSAFVLSREAINAMRPREGGSLLYTASGQGIHGASCEAAYAATKAGLMGLAKSLAREVGPCGIRVNCLAPGVIDCGMMAGYSADDKEALRRDTPLLRLGTAEDVAQAALFLCSDAARFISGQVLGVDGGLVL